MSKFRPYETKSTGAGDAVVKDVDVSSRTVTGYFSKFGNVDSDNDIMMPGSAKKSIQENGPDSQKSRIKHLWQHDSWQPLSTPRVLKEDQHGIYFESTIANTTLGNDTLILYQEGVITEHSIGFNIIDSEKDDTTGVRSIKQIRMWEGSTVTWGANADTPFTGFKAMLDADPEFLTKKLKSIRRVLHGESISDDTCYQLDIWLNQMETALKELKESADQGIISQVGIQPPGNDISDVITLDAAKGAIEAIIAKTALEMSIQRITKI